MINKVAVVDEENCSNCKTCIRVCNHQAITYEPSRPGYVYCPNCGVGCEIAPGKLGACHRYVNEGGKLVRNRPLAVPAYPGRQALPIERPLLTAVGAGTSYPDYLPANYIAQENLDGIDVVTAVTEAPISYSTLQVKVDTNFYIGKEGAKVRRDGKVVGMVTTEQYGAHVLHIGGVNLIKGPNGVTVTRTIVELANGERVRLEVDGGSVLDLQVGQRPVIDGKEDSKMRVGCGGATIGLFGHHLKGVVDEAIILDHHIIGLFSQHPLGRTLTKPTGVTPVGRYSSPGRYFGRAGSGWGGTDVTDPRQAIKEIDLSVAWEGMTILVTETTARQAALFRLKGNGELEEIPLTPEVERVLKLIGDNCEEARVSALYYAGVGGSCRAGITTNPILLTRAVHEGKAVLTIGGAPAFVLPGGGITFLADVEKMVPKPFTWVPTPAVVAPVEFTTTREVYEKIGGHVKAIRPLKEILAAAAVEFVDLEK